MGLFKRDKYLESYIDKDGKEFVVLTNETGISEVRYVRDLVKEAFGDTTEYDKAFAERMKGAK